MFAFIMLYTFIIVLHITGPRPTPVTCAAVYHFFGFYAVHCVSFATNLYIPLSAGDAFKRIHTVFPQLKFDRN